MIVTLLTDFGTRDGYVGAMKGVILSLYPQASIHDLTHDIPAGDIGSGAFALVTALPFFPDASIHVAVVDPGVGTARRPLLIEVAGRYLIGPDNGLLASATRTLAKSAQENSGAAPVVRVLDRPEMMRAEVSSTFHGRDIFAPAAGRLAAGVDPERLGTTVDSFAALEQPGCITADDGSSVSGAVAHIDRFGNLITSIPRELLVPFGREVRIEIAEAGLVLSGLSTTYGDVESGSPAALVSSDGRLEIAVRDGSAAARYAITTGTGVRVSGDDRVS